MNHNKTPTDVQNIEVHFSAGVRFTPIGSFSSLRSESCDVRKATRFDGAANILEKQAGFDISDG